MGTSAAGMGEACKQRHSSPALKQPSFNWNTQDKYRIIQFQYGSYEHTPN